MSRPSIRPRVLPRELCRFVYLPRPEYLASHKFEESCLLEARHKAPFAESAWLVLKDPNGASIWWWQCEADTPASNQDLPESLCHRLPDGWHHLRLDSGYEARHVLQGAVVASAWQRSPFGPHSWQAFIRDQHFARIGPQLPPPAAVLPMPAIPQRQVRGRVLVRAADPLLRFAAGSALAAAAIGGWWFGETAAFEQVQARQSREAQRLERTLSDYALFASTRMERAEIERARSIVGSGRAGIALARALRIASGLDLQVLSFRIDRKELEIGLRRDTDPALVRKLAAQLEALPEFSALSGRDADHSDSLRLTASVHF